MHIFPVLFASSVTLGIFLILLGLSLPICKRELIIPMQNGITKNKLHNVYKHLNPMPTIKLTLNI